MAVIGTGLVWPRLLRAGMARALEGVMAKASLVIGAITALGAMAIAATTLRHGGAPSATPALAAGLEAWGAGVLLCFAASVRAFERDRQDGWPALLARHGFGATAYLGARIAGLASCALLVVAGGTLLVGLVALLGAHDPSSARESLSATFASLMYAIAFSISVSAISVATLAPRSRGRGYLFLLLVLVLPALVADWTGRLVPSAWSELVSVPGALDALRESLHGSFDAARAVRAAAVLAAVTMGATVWARAQLAEQARGQPA